MALSVLQNVVVRFVVALRQQNVVEIVHKVNGVRAHVAEPVALDHRQQTARPAQRRVRPEVLVADPTVAITIAITAITITAAAIGDAAHHRADPVVNALHIVPELLVQRLLAVLDVLDVERTLNLIHRQIARLVEVELIEQNTNRLLFQRGANTQRLSVKDKERERERAHLRSA